MKQKSFLQNILLGLQRPKVSKKAWITHKELPKYFKKIIWILRMEAYSDSLLLLCTRIQRLIERSGFGPSFYYLKEVYRLTIRYLAGHGEPKSVLPNTVLVKRDHLGLPTIIPLVLRKLLVEFRSNQRNVQGILSCLSVFRVFPVKVVPKLGTITDPFQGVVTTFDKGVLKAALKELIPSLRLVVNPPKLIQLESAGPNGSKSAWTSSLDALAFSFSDVVLYFKAMSRLRGTSFAWWILCLKLLSLPITTVLTVVSDYKRPEKGKLSIVLDQAGKARVIAITNWWIQLALKPIHNSIFKCLGKIKEDGTFDQLGPLKRLFEIVPDGQVYHSFDLSAATDRLPIGLQHDIIEILVPQFGDLWQGLLDIDWSFRGKYYKYAVGQPMGAYSSWAMLALTHHVIVRIAAGKVGYSDFTKYCILGDDIVIADDKVAEEYFNLMRLLGVSINLSKSVQSSDFAEFAKVWMGPKVQITPMGPGLTLRLVRDKKYLTTYISTAWKLSFINTLHEVLSIVSSLSSSRSLRSERDNIMWASFGLSSFLSADKSHIDERSIMWCFSYAENELPLLRYHLYNALLQLKIDDKKEALRQLSERKEFFYQNWYKIFSSKCWSHRLIEAFLKLVGPGLWIYAFSYEEDEAELAKSTLLNVDPTWSVIYDLAQSDDAINVNNIDWTQKQAVKDQSARLKKLYREMEFSRETFTVDDWAQDRY